MSCETPSPEETKRQTAFPRKKGHSRSILVEARHPEGTVPTLQIRSQPRNDHRAIAAHQHDAALPLNASVRVCPQGSPWTSCTATPLSGEQGTGKHFAAGPPQLPRSNPPTREINEAEPLKTSQTVTGTEALERRNPPGPTARVRRISGNPTPLRRTLSTAFERSFQIGRFGCGRSRPIAGRGLSGRRGSGCLWR